MELTQTKFKKTELGWIPMDWELRSLKEIGEFKNGINKAVGEFGFGFPFANLMDVFGQTSIKSNSSFALINSNSTERNLYNLKSGDVLFIRSSVKPSGVGLTSLIEKDLKDTVFSGFIIRFRDNGFLENDYKKHCFYSSYFRNSLIANSTVSANTNINQGSLGKLLLVVPPLTEQKAIATALSNVDELIAKLEKLIEKKKAIKQGAMQALLTPPHKGGKRLDGFSGEWVEMRLGDLCKITTGKLDANAMVQNGEYRFYTCARDYYYIDSYAFNTEALLVSGNGANVGYIHYYNGKFNAYQRTYVLDKFSENIQFIKLLLEVYLASRIKSEKFEGNTPYIVMETLTGTLFYAPPSSLEQSAIATILIEMETELEGFERQKAKYQNLKEGMMQELLTGRTRLI